MNKSVFLGLSILKWSKILMYKYWCHYVKPKYSVKVKLCQLGKYSFIVNIKAGDISKDIAEDVQTGFATSSYELDKPLPKGKKKK